jgi:hypothetical protein
LKLQVATSQAFTPLSKLREGADKDSLRQAGLIAVLLFPAHTPVGTAQ